MKRLEDRGCRAFRPRVDGLELRQLPSAAPAGFVRSLAIPSNGEVRKRPAFALPTYVGPLRANLNLAATKAVLRPGKGLTLSATVAAKINARPATAGVDDASFFVFGINRGGPQATALFPSRPGIRFDAVIVAAVRPEGVGLYVQDIAGDNVPANLDASRVRITGRTIRVTVPPNVPQALPGAAPASRMRFATWTRSRLEHGLADIDHYVASFAPENATARVRVARRG